MNEKRMGDLQIIGETGMSYELIFKIIGALVLYALLQYHASVNFEEIDMDDDRLGLKSK